MNKQKHIAFIYDVLPHTNHGGSLLTAYSMALGLLQSGFKVSLIALGGNEDDNPQAKEELIKQGAELHFLHLSTKSYKLDKKILAFFSNKLEYIFPSYQFKEKVAQVIDQLKPDMILTYHWYSAASAYGIKGIPKVCLVGDPVHLPNLFRRDLYDLVGHNPESIRKRIINFLFSKSYIEKQKKAMALVLNDSEKSGAFAAHDARDFEKLGVAKCGYFHTPLPDPQKYTHKKAGKFKIALIGHLKGIATLAGVNLLVREIIPNLDQKVGQDNYEIHVIGGFAEQLPKELKDGLNHPSVILRGPIYPADEEFLTADLLLVPTPIELGIRVRIVTALSFGTLVVAHKANKEGIPELVHGENALLGSSGEEIANQIVQVVNNEVDPAKLRKNGRKTYEERFTLEAFIKEFEKLFL